MSQIYQPEEVAYAHFTTANSSGVATNADSTPVCKLLKNGAIDAAVTVTVTNIETGVYSASYTIPTTYATGDLISIFAIAIVGGNTGKAIVQQYRLTTSISAMESLIDQNTTGIAALVSNTTTTAAEVNTIRPILTTAGVVLADGAITAAKIAADALTSAKMDSTVGVEIANAVAAHADFVKVNASIAAGLTYSEPSATVKRWSGTWNGNNIQIDLTNDTVRSITVS